MPRISISEHGFWVMPNAIWNNQLNQTNHVFQKNKKSNPSRSGFSQSLLQWSKTIEWTFSVESALRILTRRIHIVLSNYKCVMVWITETRAELLIGADMACERRSSWRENKFFAAWKINHQGHQLERSNVRYPSQCFLPWCLRMFLWSQTEFSLFKISDICGFCCVGLVVRRCCLCRYTIDDCNEQITKFSWLWLYDAELPIKDLESAMKDSSKLWWECAFEFDKLFHSRFDVFKRNQNN